MVLLAIQIFVKVKTYRIALISDVLSRRNASDHCAGTNNRGKDVRMVGPNADRRLICPEDCFDTYFLSTFAFLDTQLVDGVCTTETVEDNAVSPTCSPSEEEDEEAASSSSSPTPSTKMIVFLGVKLPIFLIVPMNCLFW